MDAHDNSALLEPGVVFQDRYEIVRCLSQGGMGAIYEVVHVQTKRRRALKVMLPGLLSNRSMRARFQLEATVAAQIQSDHIAEVIDAGVDEATSMPFLVMELLHGEELGEMLEERGALPREEAIHYLLHTAYAMDKAHAAGVVHRDLKPENLFVTYADDGVPRLKVLDFGIAKVVDDAGQGNHTKGIVGTPRYISPEQVSGQHPVSAQTDLYALTQIAYTLLVGECYWAEEVDEADAMLALLVRVSAGHEERPTARAKRRCCVFLPPDFDAWFDRGAAVDPADRFECGIDLVTALAEVLDVPLDLPRSSVLDVNGSTLASGATRVASRPRLPSSHTPASHPEPPSSLATSKAGGEDDGPASSRSFAATAAATPTAHAKAPASDDDLSRLSEQTGQEGAATTTDAVISDETLVLPERKSRMGIVVAAVVAAGLWFVFSLRTNAPTPEANGEKAPAGAEAPAADASAGGQSDTPVVPAAEPTSSAPVGASSAIDVAPVASATTSAEAPAVQRKPTARHPTPTPTPSVPKATPSAAGYQPPLFER